MTRTRLSVYVALVLCVVLSACHRAAGGAQSGESVPNVNDLLSTPGPTFTVPASAVPARWSVIAYGDTRFTDPANHEATNPEARRALVAQIAKERPDALVISGDLPLDGSVANDYAIFHDETAAWRQAGLRVYPTLGNHELKHGQDIAPTNWWAAFPELNHRRWYSVAFGNSLILSVDSDLPLTEGSRQQLWVKDQIEHLPATTKYVFVSLHHPPVADGIANNPSHDARPNEQALAALLEAMQPNTHAAFVVIAGHIHNYERFNQNGVIYLVSGGGGAHPYPVNRTPRDFYQDPSFPNFHYVRFEFDGKTLHATMVRLADPAASTPVWEKKDTFDVPQRP